MLATLAKAAIYRPPAFAASSLIMPQQVLSQQHRILPAHFDNYHRLVNWPAAMHGYMHPNYIQVLTLPMQLSMMTQSPFPFKALGLVHIANKINVISLPKNSSNLTLNTYFGDVFSHKRGMVFELHSEACENDVVTIKATSYYLARVNQQGMGSAKLFSESELLCSKQSANIASENEDIGELVFEENAGRQYAKASGDYNPIHLWPLTSRFFGFKQAIAHGMNSHAQSVSLVAANTQCNVCETTSIRAVFKQPILLPSKTRLSVSKYPQERTLHFSLNGEADKQRSNKTRQHISGVIAPL
ncbi:MaoC/PaaZ C-terminal domain-containing protein [Glaciecola siphonariae]|uniref:MaoC/PaaZ C-terminal domain-containing protein n=1 Tax=Glaciecola siphonariae TaxID=521012 RepID=A0ABV9LZT1_9ALTE